MKHHFCRYELSLLLYQEQEISPAILPYEERFERSLLTEMVRCSRELKWPEMWTKKDLYDRLQKGWKLIIFRPKNQIKGWVWINPEKSEICNLYVSKWSRKQGWGTELVFAGLNEILNLEKDEALYRVDTWNTASKKCIERVLELTGISCKLSFVEEDY